MRQAFLLAAGLSATFALVSCGGSGSTTAGGTGSSAVGGETGVTPLRVSGGGAEQFRVQGGDNSIQEFGSEGDSQELRKAAAAVHSFLVARVSGEWARACDLLAANQVESLEGLTAKSSTLHGEGCPAALAVLTPRVSPTVARRATAMDARSLRRDGNRAFLLYTGPPGETVYAFPLTNEERAWRLSATGATTLAGT
jgi:hypothetical protein